MLRVAAFLIDWVLIAAWGGCAFAIVWLLNDHQVPTKLGPWLGQAVGFLAMTLPVTIAFAALESGRRQASPGKRIVGLSVTDRHGQRARFSRTLARNATRFTPWECGHMVAHHAIAAGNESVPGWLYLPMALSFVVPVWWAAALLKSGCMPYDRWTATRVGRASHGQLGGPAPAVG